MGHYCWCLNQSHPQTIFTLPMQKRTRLYLETSIHFCIFLRHGPCSHSQECDFRIKQETILLWLFVDGDRLCSLEYYIMMTISFVVFKLLAQPSLTSCMVNLHSQHIFVEMHVPSYIQHLHVLSLSAVEWYTHSFIIHIFSFFIYYSQAIILIS